MEHVTTPPPAAPPGTRQDPRVTVRGEARLQVAPEIARIAVTVAVRDTGRRRALEALTRRNNNVRELIDSYGDVVEETETGALLVAPELTRHGRGERIRSYHGRVRLTATLNDFTALGELTSRLADLELTTVEGPWWALRPDSPVHRQARQQAVREAVNRAREYAEALGAQLADLLEITDRGAEDAEPSFIGYEASRGFAGAPGAAAAEPAPALDLEPQQQTVRAHVNARFTMTRPEL